MQIIDPCLPFLLLHSALSFSKFLTVIRVPLQPVHLPLSFIFLPFPTFSFSRHFHSAVPNSSTSFLLSSILTLVSFSALYSFLLLP
ncbi:uncharacterized protein F4807DRAFT_47603 [Annulohypoxylon truncatum]|uniref:uncharacterized protein n=1 Tax=Annulohypoxylon truncatum TaxID=327061 RepID=UPI002008099F|nr:uncharacterized protein F4807DRAFT_47603 [Annulohypoxylon truncatum]KAI1211023.1 hypothetical protein F4807DRAFT_47603 [Annulohypoxylon truncatum]